MTMSLTRPPSLLRILLKTMASHRPDVGPPPSYEESQKRENREQRETNLESLHLGVDTAVKEHLLDTAFVANGGVDLVVQTVPQTRHTGKDGGTQSLDVFEQLQNVSLEKSYAAALAINDALQSSLEDVSQRKITDVHIVAGHLKRIRRERLRQSE